MDAMGRASGRIMPREKGGGPSFSGAPVSHNGGKEERMSLLRPWVPPARRRSASAPRLRRDLLRRHQRERHLQRLVLRALGDPAARRGDHRPRGHDPRPRRAPTPAAGSATRARPPRPRRWPATPGAAVVINTPGPQNSHSSLIEIESGSGTEVTDWIVDGFEVANSPHHGIDIRITNRITVRNCYVHHSAPSGSGDGIFLAFASHPTSRTTRWRSTPSTASTTATARTSRPSAATARTTTRAAASS